MLRLIGGWGMARGVGYSWRDVLLCYALLAAGLEMRSRFGPEALPYYGSVVAGGWDGRECRCVTMLRLGWVHGAVGFGRTFTERGLLRNGGAPRAVPASSVALPTSTGGFSTLNAGDRDMMSFRAPRW